MKTASIIGSTVVSFALIFYSIGFIKENRRGIVSSGVLMFFTLGVVFDISATILMIIGSSKGILTLHGAIGYSSLIGMITETSLLWKHYLRASPDTSVSKSLHIYSKIAYVWWIVAYITGGLLVLFDKIVR